jgi:phage replication-related protein YjqB (UPF0714/DUF867 family)
VHDGTAAAARFANTTGAPLTRPFNVTLDTDFIFSENHAPARLTEQLLGDEAADGLAILAPHGGRIETGTDIQAALVYDLLAERGASVRAWIVRGFNPTTGAHACWHITSSEISERSFPSLGSLFGQGSVHGPFAHAVAFHGHNDSEAIVIGGGLPNDDRQTALKQKLRSMLSQALRTVTDRPPPIEVRRSGPLAGVQPENIVNRITIAGNGIQLEQPLAVRADERQRSAVARAVTDFYCLTLHDSMFPANAPSTCRTPPWQLRGT